MPSHRKKEKHPLVHGRWSIVYFTLVNFTLEALYKLHTKYCKVSYNYYYIDNEKEAARTLLERFSSKIYDFNTQFTHVSRHPGT